MLVARLLGIILPTCVVFAMSIPERGIADSFALATAIGGHAIASASAVSPALSGVSAASQTVQTVPVVQNVQIVQHVPLVKNYQTVQYVPVDQRELQPFGDVSGYGSSYGGSAGGFGLAGSVIGGAGFGRHRNFYSFRTRGLSGFGHRGFGGGKFKARFSSAGNGEAGGFAVNGGAFIGGGSASLLG